MLPNGSPFFVAAFASPSASITGVRISGNLGADGGGHLASSSLPLESHVDRYLYSPPPPSPPPPRPPPGPPGSGVCSNTCHYAGDGDCDDGGAGGEYSQCFPCTDCADCGPRAYCHFNPPSPSPPPPAPGPPGTGTCVDSCRYASDGDCDDGGGGSEFTACSACTDCTDCGPRAHCEGFIPSPPGPPGLGFCDNSCRYAGDGDCDDGGAGNEFSGCTPCTDCADCGPRAWCGREFHPPSPSPPPPAPAPANTIHGFYKAVYGAQSDPSVNHLILAPSSGSSQVGLTSDSDLHMVELDKGVSILYYVLWGGTTGKQYSEANFQSVVDAVSASCFEQRELAYAPSPPPGPPDTNGCHAHTCGFGTCYDFWLTSCEHVPNTCGCPAECCGHTTPPAPPTPPPPMPARPKPLPLACSASCAGATCGDFYPSFCGDLQRLKGCDCSGCCTAATDLTCATNKWSTVGLPHLYAFTEGLTGRGIRDGGSDMFDGANYLAVILGDKYQYNLEYTQDCNGLFPTQLANGDGTDVYSTCKLTDGDPVSNSINGRSINNGDVSTGTLFAASFYSPERKINGFLTYGNLGADGGGAFVHMNLTGSLAETGVYGYYKQVYGAGSDPSINHLVITRAPPKSLTWNGQARNTNSDYHSVHFTEGQEMLVYLLWAGKLSDEGGWRSFQYDRNHVQRVLDAIGESCFSFLPPSTHPEPSPPPAHDTSSPDCARPCGNSCPGPDCKTTCASFVGTSCQTLSSSTLPFTCDCGQCCDRNSYSPPPPPPPKPPSAPRPLVPDHGTCSRPCAGSTCGAFQPMMCNDFTTVLGCDCSGCCESELDARCVEKEWPGNFPGLYSFAEGILGYYIRDGGRDMFDHGNEVRLRIGGQWSGALDYTQNCDGSQPRLVGRDSCDYAGDCKGDVTYITCKLPVSDGKTSDRSFGKAFVFIAYSPGHQIDGLSIMGNLGADEGGAQEANYGNDPLRGPSGVVGYYKKTFGANDPGRSLADPSVNHLIFGQGIEGAEVSIGSTTDSDLHELKFAAGTNLVYYVMFAGSEGYNYPRANFENIIERFASSCYGAYYEPSTGTGAGTIFLYLLLFVCGIGAIGALVFCAYTGKLSEKLSEVNLPGMRSRTSPSVPRHQLGTSTINLGAAPLQTPRAVLAANDSAAQEYATAYTPPPTSIDSNSSKI